MAHGAGTTEQSSGRNKTIYIRKIKKRIAYLEEKLLAIRGCTTLQDAGTDLNRDKPGGRVVRQMRRIDVLEGKLLTIRELANIYLDSKMMRAIEGRHVGEARVKQGVRPNAQMTMDRGRLTYLPEDGQVEVAETERDEAGEFADGVVSP